MTNILFWTLILIKCGDTINSNAKISYEKFRTFYDEKDKILHDKLKEECENVLLNNRKKI